MPRSASPAPRRRSARSRSASPAPQREVELSVTRPVQGATMASNWQRFTLFFLTCITELGLFVCVLQQLKDYFECSKETSHILGGCVVFMLCFTTISVTKWLYDWLQYDLELWLKTWPTWLAWLAWLVKLPSPLAIWFVFGLIIDRIVSWGFVAAFGKTSLFGAIKWEIGS